MAWSYPLATTPFHTVAIFSLPWAFALAHHDHFLLDVTSAFRDRQQSEARDRSPANAFYPSYSCRAASSSFLTHHENSFWLSCL
jgi:hypothetical protein